MAETFDEIIKKYKLAAAADGSYDTSHITDPSEKDYVDRRIAVQKSFDAVNAAAEASAASNAPSPSSTLGRSYGSGTMAELERANALWEKTQKYMKLTTKQAGMEGLGVSQTAMIRARNDHLNRIERIKEAATPVYSGGGGGGGDSDQEMWVAKGETAIADIDGIYGDVATNAEDKQAAVDALLAGFSEVPELQSYLSNYAKGHAVSAENYDLLKGYYAQSTEGGAGGEAPADGAEGGAEGSASDGVKNAVLGSTSGGASGGGKAFDYADVDLDGLLELYGSMSEKEQIAFDKYLEALGIETVGDKIESMAEVDENVKRILETLENDSDGLTVEEYKKVLADFTNMSPEMCKSIEKDMEVAEYTERQARAKAIEANEEMLATDVESMAEVDIPTLGEEETAQLFEYFKQYLNGDETVNTSVISQEAWDKYAKAIYNSLTSRKGAWELYQSEAKRLGNEKYQAQMSGDKAIELENGERWFIANSPEGDAERFMEENEEAVNKALGEYGNTKNPNIPDKTVIEVNGANLMYDKTSGTWRYVTAERPNGRHAYTGLSGTQYVGDYYVINGQEKKLREVKHKKTLDSINEVGLGDKAENGKVLTVNINKKAQQFVLFNGKWYHLD